MPETVSIRSPNTGRVDLALGGADCGQAAIRILGWSWLVSAQAAG